ncbi:MAG: serine hydrolase [Actinomycetota bacterium]|nr:serine hydrolase [Actinomycetota bacterium]
MDPSLLAVGWPGEPAVIVSARRSGTWQTVAAHGDLDAPRAWASVSKLLTAWAGAIELHEARARLDEALGPEGSTLAHLLAHASGLGLESGDPVVAPGVRRVYSNVGIDLAAAHLAQGERVGEWLDERVLTPLGLSTTSLRGRAAEGAVGSTRDLADFAREWVQPTLTTTQRRDATTTAFLPELAGVVPGFGRFAPCPWGLGVELRGDKLHWMGDWPPSSFGHFGRSGAMLLANVDEGICLVATSTVDFGPWARDLWPAWTSKVRHAVLAS